MITLITGPMSSGKTSLMLQKLERARIAGKRVVLYRPLNDTRDFLTHSGIDKLDSYPIHYLQSVGTSHEVHTRELADSSFDIIGIDEGQFVFGLRELVLNGSLAGKKIYISALHATSESRMFEEIINLIPHCDEIIKLNAVCTSCGSDVGNYTSYKGGVKPDVWVGGLDEYTSLCRECYFQAHPELKKDY